VHCITLPHVVKCHAFMNVTVVLQVPNNEQLNNYQLLNKVL